jgi:hypothetical protein
MSKNITQIPFRGILIDCFPDKENEMLEIEEAEITDEQWWAVARWWRNALLSESDWSQVSDNSLTEAQREIWRQYRQDLRNIGDDFADPKTIVFPDIPA